MRKKKRRVQGKKVWYRQDPKDPKQLILRNGTLIRKGDDDVGLYITMHMRVYSLNRYGLVTRRVDDCKKKNYCKKIICGSGHHQGERYPHVEWQGKKYHLHTLMAKAWKGGVPIGMVADHIDGNIDDFSYDNIRVIDIPENNRCGGILKRLRNIAKKRSDPASLPVNIENKDLLEIFERTKGYKGKALGKKLNQEVERLKIANEPTSSE